MEVIVLLLELLFMGEVLLVILGLIQMVQVVAVEVVAVQNMLIILVVEVKHFGSNLCDVIK